MTKNIDLKATGTNDITVPSGSTFYISEMGVIITEWNTVTAQPTVRIGNSSDDDKQLDIHIFETLYKIVSSKFKTIFYIVTYGETPL